MLEELKYIPDPYCNDFSAAAQSGCCLPKNRGVSKADMWEDRIPGSGGSPWQLSLTVNALCGLAFLSALN